MTAATVRFAKEGRRRYSITVVRNDGTELRMSQGPGFSDYLPHDLQHLIVERALGLKRGVFGQVADGGTAGTFHARDSAGSKRDRARRRRATRRKGGALLRTGRDDAARSERATIVCLHYWMSRSNDPELRRQATDIELFATSTLDGMARQERELYTTDLLETVAGDMEQLSAQWRTRDVIEVEWPL